MSDNSHDIEANKLEHRRPSSVDNNALAQTVTLSSEQFERLYLNPKTATAGDLRKTFANPTPLGIAGVAIGLFPLSIELMGWRGSGGTFATPTTTCSIFYGGLLVLAAGIGEFIVGNTFTFVTFFVVAAHFLTFSTTFIPWFGAVAWNSAGEPGNAFAPGPTLESGLGFYALALGMFAFIFLICSIRTNLVFVGFFLSATLGFAFATAGLWYTSMGLAEKGNMFIVATGGCFLAADLLGWYLLLAIMITTVELPVPDLPLFDLSTVIKGRSRAKAE